MTLTLYALQVLQVHLLPLLEAWESGPAELQTAALNCLTLLSQQASALPVLAAAGVVPLAAHTALSSSSLVRQQRAAALLANLCAERATLHLVADSMEALQALVYLAQSPDRTVQAGI